MHTHTHLITPQLRVADCGNIRRCTSANIVKFGFSPHCISFGPGWKCHQKHQANIIADFPTPKKYASRKILAICSKSIFHHTAGPLGAFRIQGALVMLSRDSCLQYGNSGFFAIPKKILTVKSFANSDSLSFSLG